MSPKLNHHAILQNKIRAKKATIVGVGTFLQELLVQNPFGGESQSSREEKTWGQARLVRPCFNILDAGVCVRSPLRKIHRHVHPKGKGVFSTPLCTWKPVLGSKLLKKKK